MTDETDAFQFALAERLGMTVAELNASMSPDEYIQWKAFSTWRNAMQELELRTAKS